MKKILRLPPSFCAILENLQLTIRQNTGFSLNFQRTTRIKILKKDGLEWADFEIPLYDDGAQDETISGLKAVTYNLENGKIVETKAKSDGFFKEKFSDNVNLGESRFTQRQSRLGGRDHL